MQIRPLTHAPAPMAAAASRPAAATSASPDSSELSWAAFKGARWPDLNPILQGPDRAQAVQKAESTLESWLGQNVPPADPEEQPFWTGLARWMARDMVDQARPDWGRGALDDARGAVSLWDHEEGSPAPIRGEKGDPEKAVGLFRMLEGFMGDVRFRMRLANFLKSHDGKAARAEDLFNALGLQETPLNGWVENAGFPMVHARLEGNKVKLSQERMHLYPTGEKTDELWSIPIKIRYQDSSGKREFKTVLTTREAEVTLPAKGQVDWIYPNGGGKGYYRTDVAPPPLELSKLTPTERLAALSNQWRLVRHKAAPVGKFLDQLVATRTDESPSRLKIAATELRFLSPLVTSGDRPAFNSLVVEQLGPAFERLGPAPRPDEPMNDDALRRSCTMLLSAAGHPGAQAATRAWGERFLAGDTAVTPEMAAFSQDPAVCERLLATLGSDPDRQSETLRGLLTNPVHVDKTVEFALATRNEMATRYLAHLNAEKAFQLMESRWSELPGLTGMVEASTLSPWRAEIDRMVSERGPDELRARWEEVKKTDGQALNMADLPQKLSEWLAARRAPAAGETWLLAGVDELYQECQSSTPGLIDMLKAERSQWEPVFREVVEQTLEGGQAALDEIKSRPELPEQARETGLAFLEGGLTAGCFGAITAWTFKDATLREGIQGQAERLRAEMKSQGKAALRQTLDREQLRGRELYEQLESGDYKGQLQEVFLTGYKIGAAEALLVLG